MPRKSKRGNREGSIYKRPDGRWCAAVSNGFTARGKRRRKHLYGKTRAEVQGKLVKAQRDIQQGLPIGDDRFTVAAFIAKWLEHAEKSVRPRTIESYRYLATKHIIPSIGKIALSKLTPLHVQRMLDDAGARKKLSRKKAGGRDGKPLSPRTVSGIHAVIRRALSQAERWGLVQRNVAKLVDPPKVEKATFAPFSIDEAKLILKAAADDRLEALYAVALGLGLRQGEIIGLQWPNIDLEAGRLRVEHTLQRVRGAWTLSPPKSVTSRRTITIPGSLRDTLRRHRARQLEERLAAGELWQPSLDADLVFRTEVGEPIHQKSLLNAWNALQVRAGVKRRRFHDARHSAASILLAQGIQPKVVSEILGHSGIRITLDIYGHVYEQALDQAAEAMESAVFGS